MKKFLPLVLLVSLGCVGLSRDAHVVAVQDYEAIHGRDIANVTVVFDRELTSRYNRQLVVVTTDRRHFRFDLYPVAPLGEATKKFMVQYNPKQDDIVPEQMIGSGFVEK